MSPVRGPAERIESARRGVHDWRTTTFTHLLALAVFYGALAVTVVGLLTLVVAYVLVHQTGLLRGRRAKQDADTDADESATA